LRPVRLEAGGEGPWSGDPEGLVREIRHRALIDPAIEAHTDPPLVTQASEYEESLPVGRDERLLRH